MRVSLLDQPQGLLPCRPSADRHSPPPGGDEASLRGGVSKTERGDIPAVWFFPPGWARRHRHPRHSAAAGPPGSGQGAGRRLAPRSLGPLWGSQPQGTAAGTLPTPCLLQLRSPSPREGSSWHSRDQIPRLVTPATMPLLPSPLDFSARWLDDSLPSPDLVGCSGPEQSLQVKSRRPSEIHSEPR